MILEVDGNRFEPSERRMPHEYDWPTAMRLRSPEGWRVPTLAELHEMYAHRDAYGACFPVDEYWSADEYDNPEFAWRYDLERDLEYPCSKSVLSSVWLVRDVVPVPKETYNAKGGSGMILEVSGKPFELEIHREPSVYTWYEGQKMSDPDGWRLPTIAELAEMHKHKDEIAFGPASYWSQDEYDDDRAMLWSFNSGRQFEHPKCGHFSIWRVRDVEPVPEETDKAEGGNGMMAFIMSTEHLVETKIVIANNLEEAIKLYRDECMHSPDKVQRSELEVICGDEGLKKSDG